MLIFTLVILPNKNTKKSGIINQYNTFATNISPSDISQNIQNIPAD